MSPFVSPLVNCFVPLMLWSSEAHQLGVHLAFCASELSLNASPDMSLSL